MKVTLQTCKAKKSHLTCVNGGTSDPVKHALGGEPGPPLAIVEI